MKERIEFIANVSIIISNKNIFQKNPLSYFIS